MSTARKKEVLYHRTFRSPYVAPSPVAKLRLNQTKHCLVLNREIRGRIKILSSLNAFLQNYMSQFF